MLTIAKLNVSNFLSLQKVEVEFRPLNVLVGPNGAGKTNLLKVFQFLGDVARVDLLAAIDDFGGIEELLFHGSAPPRRSRISIDIVGRITKHSSTRAPDEYKLTFWESSTKGPSGQSRRMLARNEVIVVKRTAGRGRRITLSGRTVNFEPLDGSDRRPSKLSVRGTSTGLATLRRLGEEYEASQVEELAQTFEQLRLFEIDVERVRRPARIRDGDRLRPDAANLAPFLQHMKNEHEDIFAQLCDDVRFVLPGFERFEFKSIGGADEAIKLNVKERYLSSSTPLARVSFGTIRSIAIFAMLHDPNPPKITCIEEIDHGLHPHALDRVVDRLRIASQSTQIVLATHSPALVNRLTAEELIVVERDQESGATQIFRKSDDEVRQMSVETGLGLGELWFSGMLGGTL